MPEFEASVLFLLCIPHGRAFGKPRALSGAAFGPLIVLPGFVAVPMGLVPAVAVAVHDVAAAGIADRAGVDDVHDGTETDSVAFAVAPLVSLAVDAAAAAAAADVDHVNTSYSQSPSQIQLLSWHYA